MGAGAAEEVLVIFLGADEKVDAGDDEVVWVDENLVDDEVTLVDDALTDDVGTLVVETVADGEVEENECVELSDLEVVGEVVVPAEDETNTDETEAAVERVTEAEGVTIADVVTAVIDVLAGSTEEAVAEPQASKISALIFSFVLGSCFMTNPQGLEPMTLPGQPHLDEHIETQASLFQWRRAQAGPALIAGTARRRINEAK